ncbi:hypothetical protein J6590_073772 [Homalodisca vitripennis]|nr:hypothetical protein J6590_073772 [Homalodisca vitripennis]
MRHTKSVTEKEHVMTPITMTKNQSTLQSELLVEDANCWVKKQHLARDGRHLNRRGSYQLGTLFSEVFSVAFGLKKGYDTVGVIPGLEENASKEPILPEEVPCSPSDITQ